MPNELASPVINIRAFPCWYPLTLCPIDFTFLIFSALPVAIPIQAPHNMPHGCARHLSCAPNITGIFYFFAFYFFSLPIT